MDVHRSRFVPYPTSAISALAFSRTSDKGYIGPLPALKLALGRANGDIEIWNPQRGLWVQETVFPGNDNASIDGFAWTQDPDEKDAEGENLAGQQRLFSIASSPSVTEWDLATGLPKRQSTGNFSEVWCLAAQPRWKQKTSNEEAQAQDLIAGCGDGTIVLLSTADGDLQFKRFLARVTGKRARCMCITYQTRDRLVAGFADSTIRIFDTRNGSMFRTMSLGVSVPGAPKSGLVWQVRCTQSGDIVSGDSNGEVKFWDGKTYSMLQRIRGHESDCLDLIASDDGKTVISGSIDGKIAIYRQAAGPHGRKTWSRSGHRRVHTGEAKAMASFDSKNLSMVVSGGSDATPMVTPMREYGRENIRSLPHLPQEPPVASAPSARLLVSWWEHSISVWRMAEPPETEHMPEIQSPRKLLAKINLNTKSKVRTVSISTDGRILAAATSSEIKIFQLQRRIDNETLRIKKIHLPKTLATSGARLVQFSPDGKWLTAITLDSEVCIARVSPNPDRPKALQVLPKVVELERRHRTPERSPFKDYDRSITRAAFAADSSVFVVSDLAGYLDSWVLEGHEDVTAPAVDLPQDNFQADSSDAGSDAAESSSDDSDDEGTAVFYGQHWTDNPSGHLLPRLEAPALVLSFRPPGNQQASSQPLVNGNPGVHPTRSNPHARSHELPPGQHRLLVVTAKHQIHEFDILAGRLSEWSRRSSGLPEDFLKIRDRVMGAIWDIDQRRERLWLWGISFVCMMDVGEEQVANSETSQALTRKRRKPKGTTDEGEGEGRKRRKIGSGAGSRTDKAQGGIMKENLTDGVLEDGDESDDEQGILTNDEHSENKRFWTTFKYRPILGVVPLGDADKGPLEVAIVERPLWDARDKST